jgi:hypothetical protein
LKFFKDKIVNICYDVDTAGKAGADRVAEAVSMYSKELRVVELPEEGLPVNGDYTDFVRLAEDNATIVRQLADITVPYTPLRIKNRVNIPAEVVDTYLEDIIPKRLFYRRVRMRVRMVSAVYTSTYVVPQEVEVTCDRDWKESCGFCPLFGAEAGLEMNIRPDCPEVLSIVDGNLAKQREAIRSMANINEKCPRFQIKLKSFQPMYPVVIIPALEKDKPFHNYTMQEAWAYDAPAETNEDYLAEAVTMCDPETQKLSIICYKLDRDIASLENFTLDTATMKQLECFQCQDEPMKFTNTCAESTMILQTTSPVSTEGLTSI